MSAETRELPPLQLRVRIPEQVLTRQVGGEVVMLDLDRECYYGMNEVGARLMQLAEQGATLAQITDRLLVEFDVDRERIEADVRRLAGELMANGLLEQDVAK